MLSFLPAPLLGLLSSIALVLNLVFWMTLFLVVALAKLLVPIRSWKRLCIRWLSALATIWIDGNSLVAKMHDIEWNIDGHENLRSDAWYLVLSNHQTWADVFVLQTAFNRRIPFLKFFIKQELIWVPLLGFAWWALEMPFMRRHSKEAIERNPALREQDIQATRKACANIRHTPTTVMNFAEGTRFTAAKRDAQHSPYSHLLRPKSGGLALVLATLGETLTSLLDVTIVYPHDNPTFWDLLSGRLARIAVHVEERPIPDELRAGDTENPEYRARLRAWIDGIWAEKDRRIDALRRAA